MAFASLARQPRPAAASAPAPASTSAAPTTPARSSTRFGPVGGAGAGGAGGGGGSSGGNSSGSGGGGLFARFRGGHTHTPGSSGGGSPSVKVRAVAKSGSGKQNLEMQRLICDLTDQLRDKEEVIQQNQRTKDFLMKRLQRVEAALAEAGIAPPCEED